MCLRTSALFHIASSQALEGEKGAPGTHCLHMCLISQNSGKIVYLQDTLHVLLASDVDRRHQSNWANKKICWASRLNS